MSAQDKINVSGIVVLGNAVPDELSDGRKSVCTVGYHPEYGLMRIYPVPPTGNMHRWNMVSMPLERNSQDNRQESWKIQGSKSEWLTLHNKIKVEGKLERPQQLSLLAELQKKFGYGCVEDLNDNKLSLGFIKPQNATPRFEKRDSFTTRVQLSLFSDEPFLTIHNYDVQPRVTYNCPNCRAQKQHDQQILEWGIYEGIRQKPDIKEKILGGLHIGESGWDVSFLIGNMNVHRNRFMVISVYRFKV